MIIHVVFFWTDKPNEAAAAKLVEGARKYLASIPGVQEFHCGTAVPSPRGVVDESFAAALSMAFADQAAADFYQAHPEHTKFIDEYVKPYVRRTLVYDFTS